MSLAGKIQAKEAVVGVIGLGYIGIAVLEAFGKKGFSLVGFDIDEKKIEELKKLETKGHFTSSTNPEILKQADILIISVHTPIDIHHEPRLTPLIKAAESVKEALSPDKEILVIVQSTSYPGTTEELVLPILESTHLKVGKNFYLACIPEVLDVGNPEYTFSTTPKIIGGVTPACYEMAQLLYHTMTPKLHKCSSPKIAEAAKILQNTYRLINISLINEMKMMFDKMGIDIWEVIDAASTKPFGFSAFYPGPGIGGDCIPTDPLYLVWKAKATDAPTTLIEAAETINALIPEFVVHKIWQALNKQDKSIKGSKILVLGVAFKQNTADTRESPALTILSLLKDNFAELSYHDPFVHELQPSEKFPHLRMQSIPFKLEQLSTYDCVVILTDHSIYDWKQIVLHSKLIIDTRNATKGIENKENKVIKA